MDALKAVGTFEVSLEPQAPSEPGAEAGLSRMSLRKRFSGMLEATSSGEMLAFRSSEPGSAGYVALERVVGTLDGRSGSFVLQHSSTMERGTPRQSITVVPGSGTDALTGLTGSMTIEIEDGVHHYRFDCRCG